MNEPDNRKRFFKDSYQLKTDVETKAYYAEWAETYDLEVAEENGYRQPERCANALSKALAGNSAKILDIGCGTGLSGVALREAGFANIDGCDFSPEMLEKAAHTNCYQRLFETDLNQPPIDAPDDSYDAITAVGVFSFGHISPDAIDEMLRVLKSDGITVIGLNDKYYQLGAFPDKLEALEKSGKLSIQSREHGIHLENIEGSTGWVITGKKL